MVTGKTLQRGNTQHSLLFMSAAALKEKSVLRPQIGDLN